MFALALLSLLLMLGPRVQQDQQPEVRRPDIRVSGANTVLWRRMSEDFLETSPDAGESRWDVRDRLTLNLSAEDAWRFGLQADLDRFQGDEGDSRIEKRYLTYEDDRVIATAGDFYASFGDGMTLSVTKTHEAYGLENQSDDTIDGGRFAYRGESVALDLLGGRIEDRFTGLTDDIYGGMLEFSLADGVTLAGSVVKTDPQLGPTSITAGARAEARLLDNALSVSADYADFAPKNSPASGDAARGRTFYVESSLSWHDLTLTAEHKDEENYFAPYGRTPIIENERFELLADFFAIYAEDLRATKLRADYLLPNGALLYGAASIFEEHASDHPSYGRYDRDITHFYGGLEHTFADGIYINIEGGVRRERGEHFYRMFSGSHRHASAELSIPLPGLYSINTEYHLLRFEGDLVNFQRDKLSLSISKSQLFTATWMWERSNLPGEVFFSGRENYYAVQLDVKLMRRHLVRVLIGNNRGGLKCSGGVCRYIPAFGGMRFEAVLRF